MKAKAHYHGHRQRLRQRFLKGGGGALADYEMLELILFQSHPRGDVKPLAKELLARFDSFAAVISAEPAALRRITGIGDSAVAALKTTEAAAHRLLQGRIMERSVLSSWHALNDYCKASLAFSKTEQFRILFLDRKNKLIADELQQTGTVDHTPLYPREVVRRALDVGASALILVHNHPSGDAAPSSADIEMTKEVAEAGKRLGITVHDHIIVGHGENVSFKSLGLL